MRRPTTKQTKIRPRRPPLQNPIGVAPGGGVEEDEKARILRGREMLRIKEKHGGLHIDHALRQERVVRQRPGVGNAMEIISDVIVPISLVTIVRSLVTLLEIADQDEKTGDRPRYKIRGPWPQHHQRQVEWGRQRYHQHLGTHNRTQPLLTTGTHPHLLRERRLNRHSLKGLFTVPVLHLSFYHGEE